jgi:hypothetical protein
MMNFIPPGGKHLKGNTLFTSCIYIYVERVETNIALELIILHHEASLTIFISLTFECS